MVSAGDGFLDCKALESRSRQLSRTLSTSHVSQAVVTNVAGVRLWLSQQGQRYKSCLQISIPSTGVKEGSPG